MSDVVSYQVRDRVAIATIDNGKANVLGPDVIAALDEALTRAEQAGEAEVGALVITGRDGMLSGGFDLKVIMSSPAAAGQLVTAGGALFVRIFASPVPVIVACSGHAVAAGALLLLAADERIGADGAFQIGLIETQKGMVLPRWAVEFSEERLSRRHFQIATVGGRMFAPVQARDAGFLDEVVPADQVLDQALGAAAYWAGLPRGAYQGQVVMNRGARIDRLQAAIESDRNLQFGIRS